MIFAEEVKEYVKRTRTLKSNLATIFAVAWGQCSNAMKARVKTHSGYEEMSSTNNCVWLRGNVLNKQLRLASQVFLRLAPGSDPVCDTPVP